MAKPIRCFFITPFRPALHYFYLFLKRHIEEDLKKEFTIECHRADRNPESEPFLENIRRDIEAADLIIADCSDVNPNVFYEIGYAHASNKHVVLITSDPPEKIPADLRGHKFIPYGFDNDQAFLRDLDMALRHNIQGMQKDDSLFDEAKRMGQAFRASGMIIAFNSRAEFTRRIRSRTQELAAAGESPRSREFVLLPAIIQNSEEVAVMKQINVWLAREDLR